MPTPEASCPECGAPLVHSQPWRQWFLANRNEAIVIGGLILVVVAGLGFLFATGPFNNTVKADPFPQADERLRVSGNETASTRLVPALAKAWLLTRGASEVKVDEGIGPKDGPRDQSQVRGRLGGKTVAVNITGRGTTAGFADLAASGADVVFASRPITGQEAARGDLGGKVAASLIAQGAVVVITSPSRPVTALTPAQLQGHPLWLYTAAKPVNPQTDAFVQFALSDAGEAVVKNAGYAQVDRPPRPRPPTPVRRVKHKGSPPIECPKNKVAITDIGGSHMAEPFACTPLDR